MLSQRILTSIFLVPLALWGLLLLDGTPFALFCGLIATLAAWEWADLSGISSQGRLVYAASFALSAGLWWNSHWSLESLLWLAGFFWPVALFWVMTYPQLSQHWRGRKRRLLMGYIVLLPCWAGLILLHHQAGLAWLLYLLLIVWLADIAAYFSGRRYGKAKLAPFVSPGKSWAGVWGALVATSLLAWLAVPAMDLNAHQGMALWLITALTTAASVLGDLLESMLKRYRGLKDSSRLLPGHGGILDRIDSLTAAAPVFMLLYTLSSL